MILFQYLPPFLYIILFIFGLQPSLCSQNARSEIPIEILDQISSMSTTDILARYPLDPSVNLTAKQKALMISLIKRETPSLFSLNGFLRVMTDVLNETNRLSPRRLSVQRTDIMSAPPPFFYSESAETPPIIDIPPAPEPKVRMRTNDKMVMANSTGCLPKPSAVRLVHGNGSLIIHPSGIFVNRCAGICSRTSLVCKPRKSQEISRWALALVYNEETGKVQNLGPHEFLLQEDIECECQCGETPDDCGTLRKYDLNNCNCRCGNENEAVSCQLPHIWKPATCKCECPDNCRNCLQGTVYDQKLCGCFPEASVTVPFIQ